MWGILLLCLNLNFALVFTIDKIPTNFDIGFATSAYQIEGAWNEDGRGVSIWDTVAHNGNVIWQNQTGDIACDSYHKYKEDVKMLKDVGATVYRFSLAWPRILPTGQMNVINQKGIDYYNNLINELLRNKIKPMVTIFHWDLPQRLQDLGGWTNPLMANYYVEYAQLCFRLFGDRVVLWTTFNEPMQICQMGYGNGQFAPLVNAPGIGNYLCAHTLLNAHARTYHLYKNKFWSQQKGLISLVADFAWYEPADKNNKLDVEAAEIGNQFYFGWFMNPPIFGDYPKVMKDRIAKRSAQEGYSKSRLPVFTPEEQKKLRGSVDFIGVNIYMALLAKNGTPENVTGWSADMGIKAYYPQEWEMAENRIFTITAWSARKILNFIKNRYKNPIVYVTENGLPQTSDLLNDDKRITYIRDYLGEILNATIVDKVRVRGYTGWSLMDNFEWTSGYRYRFGIYAVDFNNPNRPRTARKSAQYVKKIVQSRCLVDTC